MFVVVWHITKNQYPYQFVDHIQKLSGIEIGLNLPPPTLNINKKLPNCFQSDFLALFDFPEMHLDM